MKKELKNIVCIGASTCHGIGDPENGGFVGLLRRWHESRSTRNKVYNLGIPGDCLEGIYDRLKIEVPARRPDLVIFQIGLNDTSRVGSKDEPSLTYIDLYKEIIEKIIKYISSFSQITFVGAFPIDELKTSPYKSTGRHYLLYDAIKYSQAQMEVCEENGVEFIDLIPDLLKIDYKEYLAEDGLHLNARGHEFVFQKVKTVINFSC